MSIHAEPYGMLPDGTPCQLITIRNASGLEARLTDYGATLTQLTVPGPDDSRVNLCLGYDSLQGFLRGRAYFGCTVGRVANRIAGGRFTLDGVHYDLHRNENEVNQLHGGERGFDKVTWDSELSGDDTVFFRHTSVDGDEGYPGTLKVQLHISLTEANELIFDYTAKTTRPTPVMLTNHTYWNLAGAGSILDHTLTLAADRYLVTGPQLIPSGELAPVAETALDFRDGRRIGEQLESLPGGIDHCYVLNGPAGELRQIAEVRDPASGRRMIVSTNQAAVQCYTAGSLDDHGFGGQAYPAYSGLCLETHGYADAVNHAHFPSIILRPSDTYHHRTVHRFDV